MRNENSYNRLADYGKVLFVLAITLFVYGILLNQKMNQVMDPVKDVTVVQSESNTISITTSDGSEVVPGNIIVGSGLPGIPEETFVSNKSIGDYYIPTMEEVNHIYRDTLQEKYSISIRYGRETNGYHVEGLNVTSLADPDSINEQLRFLEELLKLYPEGLFEEIKKGGLPLTVLLVDRFSEEMITGITDSTSNYAVIIIAAMYPFQDSFTHESYHYIERYLLKNGANFNSWNTLNPESFHYNYNVSNNALSYDRTFQEDAFFVNNYAQTAPEEDRASTFEYMMADHKASCLNKGNPIWYKASYMARNIDAVLKTVKPDVQEYWERFLD